MSIFFHDPLVMVARTGQADDVARLITPFYSLNSYALEKSAENGHAECVQLLIPFSEPDQDDSQALLLAAQNGHTECVRLLIPVSDMEHCAALRSAAMNGHNDCVALLKDVSNLDANATDGMALQIALENADCECIDVLYSVTDITALLNRLENHPRMHIFQKLLGEAEYKWTAQRQHALLTNETQGGGKSGVSRKM